MFGLKSFSDAPYIWLGIILIIIGTIFWIYGDVLHASNITKGIFEKTGVFKRKLLPMFFGDVIHCDHSGCHEWTLPHKTPENPRERWFINVYIGGDDENVRVNLCPKCIKYFFNLEEKHYQDIERGERLATNKISGADFYAQIAGR